MAEEKKGFFSRLVAGLEKTRKAVVYGLDDLFNGPGEVDDDFYDELEEILITGDVGVRATEEILEELRAMTEERHVRARSACRDLLIESIKSRMDLGENAYDFEKTPSVLLLIGVNGVGKTTTAGKMAAQAKADGRRVCHRAAGGVVAARRGRDGQGDGRRRPGRGRLRRLPGFARAAHGSSDLRHGGPAPQQEESDGGATED